MKLRQMTATFGKLSGDTLVLSPGLNLIHAPNESGKTTWCAFLRNMLYGLPTRDRKPTADKNRYAPWSGSPMQGVLELESSLGEITITRRTARANAPMGTFSAVYTGTSTPVDGLTAAGCGETLTGVTREIFERSAFIRQAGMAIDQDAELERRIAALITTGEEDTSYIEVNERLKKQLNRRRYNKSGLLPQLDREIEEMRSARETAAAMAAQLKEIQAQQARQAERQAALQQELAACVRWEAAQRRKALAAAEDDARSAEERAGDLRRQLAADQVPENDAIARLRGAIVNLETTRKAVGKARSEQEAAERTLRQAEAAVSESPFAGQTAEQARREAADPPAGRASYGGAAALSICGAAAAGVLAWLLWSSLGPLPALLLAAAVLAGTAAGAWALAASARRKVRGDALRQRFGTDDPDAIREMAEAYARLQEARDAARTDANAKSAAADTLYHSLSTNEQGILLEVRRFAPGVSDIAAADQQLRACAVRRKELMAAESAAREARARWEALRQQLPEGSDGGPAELAAPPARSREAVQQALAESGERLNQLQGQGQYLLGRIRALSDPELLEAELQEKLAHREAVQAEYDAIALAMEVLAGANTQLQNRFSPELGKKAAKYFAKLTAGKYNKVLLNRELEVSAGESGESMVHDVLQLSQGTADQLYLAVRLAICEMVLPREQSAPLVLDDALTSFDDERMAAALELLLELSEGRQILLFTCQEREGAYLAAAHPGQYHTVDLKSVS